MISVGKDDGTVQNSQYVLFDRIAEPLQVQLLCNDGDGCQVSGYFDIERPKFTLTRGPAWLKTDEATGLLRGTPGAPVSSWNGGSDAQAIDFIAMSYQSFAGRFL